MIFFSLIKTKCFFNRKKVLVIYIYIYTHTYMYFFDGINCKLVLFH